MDIEDYKFPNVPGAIAFPRMIDIARWECLVPTGNTYRYEYFMKDHLGNTRVAYAAAAPGLPQVMEYQHYYPFGMQLEALGYNSGNELKNNYLYNGKELQEDYNLNWYDYGARFYDPVILRWTTVDPLAERYHSISSYTYCIDNPVLLIDPNGMEWFYYSVDGKKDPTWNWRDEKKYYTGVKDNNGKEVVLQGQEAVVTFDGSKDEKLGEGQNLFGKDAKLADVTVYGPKGADDIKSYKGFTMTSDPSKFGVVADGDYTVNRLAQDDRKGPYGSDLVLESRDAKIPEQDNFNPAYPYRNPAYLQGVFIHRSNNTGWAGWKYDKNGKLRAVSEGCLLIAPSQWNQFHSQLDGVNSFLLQLRRK